MSPTMPRQWTGLNDGWLLTRIFTSAEAGVRRVAGRNVPQRYYKDLRFANYGSCKFQQDEIWELAKEILARLSTIQ